MAELGVIGLGSTIRGDDGIGVALVHELDARKLPESVELYDAGTSGMNILHHLKDFDRVIIIDAIRQEGDPGDWVFFHPEDVSSSMEIRSTHDANLFEALKLSETLGERPEEVVIMGVIPADLSLSEDLSPELEERLPELVGALEEKVQEMVRPA
ncbi:hydrogenase maturation protease [Candidatus Bipolaricaulota bacterium]|nr:hydrogenase maturation protease [Candidatus Bipolaricaulota bacterium]